nr:phage tail sheath family protein [Clostridia bacterium]
MAKHGVYVLEQATSAVTPATVETGVPMFFGASPIQNADNPATPGVPVLCTTWNEAVQKLGYSDDWATYPLCEAMYSHFKLFNMSPAIFCNVLDASTMKSAVAAADKNVVSKKVALTKKAIPGTVVVKAQGGNGTAYVLGTDYDLYFSEEVLTVELLSGSTHYSESTLNIAYDEVTPASVTANAVANAAEAADLCMSTIGLVPDLLLAPGYSDQTAVAAVLAAKAAAINGMFRAKAIIDLSTAASGGADTYDEVIALKNSNNFTDENEIVCWPLVKLGDYTFHLSTQVAGVIASTDADYGAPHVSPSNKGLQCDSLVTVAGTEVILSLEQANILNGGGVVTGLNFMGGFKVWGNYTGCYPTNQDVKDYFISVSRMIDFIGNTLIRTFWGKIDEPMTRRFIDTILDSCNIWLNGLTGAGYILGGRCEMLDSENPLTNLMAGIVKLHVFVTPPSPAQEIDFVLEYDPAYVTEALS